MCVVFFPFLLPARGLVGGAIELRATFDPDGGDDLDLGWVVSFLFLFPFFFHIFFFFGFASIDTNRPISDADGDVTAERLAANHGRAWLGDRSSNDVISKFAQLSIRTVTSLSVMSNRKSAPRTGRWPETTLGQLSIAPYR